jgi:hypothetical protein
MRPSANREQAEDFIGFLAPETGKAIHQKHGWIPERLEPPPFRRPVNMLMRNTHFLMVPGPRPPL